MLVKKILSCVTILIFLTTTFTSWGMIHATEGTQVAALASNEGVTNNVYKELKDNNRKKIKELPEKRTKFSKTFLNDDNTLTVVKSTYAQHHQNSGGEWVGVNNKIKQITNKTYGNVLTDETSIVFQKESAITTISDKQYSIRYEPVSNQSVIGNVYENMIDYTNVWYDTVLRYRLQNDSLKMDLLLETKEAPKKFNFKIESKGLTPIKNVNGTIVFINENQEVMYVIPRMWVKDSASDQLRFDKLTTNVIKNSSSYLLEIILDDTNLQYPLLIDPTTISKKTLNMIMVQTQFIWTRMI
ncbi:hypothetical protein [Paenibacillus periandrae]|uniref:hypothetical protein n=1 Tax=Paenibacillus periandrae TaxID=1761741 RepID=UPI001F089E02|nr:hypothetical protein [Paenibacillus periandrae]